MASVETSADRLLTVVAEADLREVLTYWLVRRRGTDPPERSDVEPTDLRRHLPRLALIDTADDLADFRIRLFGTQLVREFGEERTGCRLGDLARVENPEAALAAYAAVRDTRQPHYQPARRVSSARVFRCYSRLIMPLRAGGPSIGQVLVAFHFETVAMAEPGHDTTW